MTAKLLAIVPGMGVPNQLGILNRLLGPYRREFFTMRYDLVSGDAHHGHIAGRLAVLAPGAPALRVVEPPRFA